MQCGDGAIPGTSLKGCGVRTGLSLRRCGVRTGLSLRRCGVRTGLFPGDKRGPGWSLEVCGTGPWLPQVGHKAAAQGGCCVRRGLLLGQVKLLHVSALLWRGRYVLEHRCGSTQGVRAEILVTGDTTQDRHDAVPRGGMAGRVVQ